MNPNPEFSFDFNRAFDRNIGWLTPGEQSRLRKARIVIAGVGGAGGYAAQSLARLGISRFRLADPDIYELTNLNRQIGATVKTLGSLKTQVMKEMILSVNPEAEVETIDRAIDSENIEAFLNDADLVIDGIDFLAISGKILLFKIARQKGIPAVTSCPLGFGASLICFSPSGMSFEDYLALSPGMTETERRLALAFGLSPNPLCLRYMNSKAFSFSSGRAASVAPGLMLVGALAATECVKLITGKGKTLFAPHLWQIDLLTWQVRKKYYPFGMKGPWMQAKRWLVYQILKARTSEQGKDADCR